MKKILAIVLSFVVFSSTFANSPIVNEKVLRSFDQTFTNVESVKWEEFKDHYTVSFMHAGIQSVVNYDKDGQMLSSIRYYLPKMLPLYIFNKLKKEYTNDTLFGVTEVIYGEDVLYFVKIESAKNWITVKIDPSGNSEIYKKYRKG
ncbi:MAG TPA: hypothetical protein VM012_09560 [Flavitalea sp.]|nr:hypothetical protein [Flavitalea sp.]